MEDARPAEPAVSSTERADRQGIAERAARSLYAGDRASQALGMTLVSIAPGEARVTMTVRDEMLNGHRTCHGGIIFALADSAFAFACNSYGENTVAAAASIDYLAPGRADDRLTASARELWRAGRSGIYEVSVTNQRDEQIALFRGRSHRIEGRLVE